MSFTAPDNWKAGRIWVRVFGLALETCLDVRQGRRDCNFNTTTGPTCLTGWCNGGLLCDPHTGTVRLCSLCLPCLFLHGLGRPTCDCCRMDPSRRWKPRLLRWYVRFVPTDVFVLTSGPVSLVDGYDLPMAITNNVGCQTASCPVDLGPICACEQTSRVHTHDADDVIRSVSHSGPV